MGDNSKKNVLVIELNELNVELLTSATAQHSFPTLTKILALPHATYKTNDRYNSGFLEPWVQWVSVHTGKPASLHQIKHLGDVPHLSFEQCWEVLSQHHVTTGVWGVMNGARRDAKHNLFFLPDPWTFSEWGTPSRLDNLLDLPRYISKNYQNLSKLTLIKKALKLLKFILFSNVATQIILETFKLIAALKRLGKKHYIYISYFDFISTLLFIQYKKKFKPQCSFLFLNALAHLQHHHWDDKNAPSPQILFGLNYIERLLTQLLKAFPLDAIVVHNGLSQMNTNHEKPWILYRQKDHPKFVRALNLSAIKIEPHMTHDAHVFFKNKEDCEVAFGLLKKATIKRKSLFHVETSPDPCKLFYQLKFTDELESDVEFEFNQIKYRFFDHFDRIVERTGRHIPIGNVYSDTLSFPDHINNHDFNTYLFHYLLPEKFSLREAIEQEIYANEEA